MYSLLYCLGCKRLKNNKSFDEYKDLLLSIICEDNIYAKKIMKYLSKYESEDGLTKCSILAVRNKRKNIKKYVPSTTYKYLKNKLYFIDFVDDNVTTHS